MITSKKVGKSYDDIDELWRLSFGDFPDITAAFYDGDFSYTLEQHKHSSIDWF